MIDTLEVLKKILNNNILLPPLDDKGTLRVKEHAREAKIKTLDILCVPENSVAFTLDHTPQQKNRRVCYQQLSCYLNPGQKFINKGCDLVLISYFKQKWYVLISDLKSDKPKLKDTEAQLKNSRAFVDYILSLITTHYPDKAITIPVSEFKLVIVTTRIKKSSTYKPNDAKPNDRPFRELTPLMCQEKNRAKIYFGELIGN